MAPVQTHHHPMRQAPSLLEGIDYDIQVSALGDTVWVSAADSSCIGRFSKRFGIDVHRTATEQLNGAPECLFCTHGAAGPAEWELFRSHVLRHYGIAIPADMVAFNDAPGARRLASGGAASC